MRARSSAVIPVLLLMACSTGQVRPPKQVVREDSESESESEREPRETEADRVAARRKAAEKIVPSGSACLPLQAKGSGSLHLELAALADSARVCAIDTEEDRLLGPVGCWNVDLTAGALAYQEPAPLPARGFAVELDGMCARGFCLPEKPKRSTVQIAWSVDGKQAAVLADRKIHLFDAASLAHKSSFSLEKSEGAVVGLHHMGTHLIVQTRERSGDTTVWVYEPDGTQVGAVTSAPPGDEHPLSTSTGALALLDAGRIAVGEHGFEELTTFELASGTKTRITRKPPTKLKCKPPELEAFWHDPSAEDIGADCKASLAPLRPFIGATVIAGRTNLLALLRGDREGQLAVIDSKTLVEKKAITLPWCAEEAPKAKPSKPKHDDDEDSEDEDEDDDRGAKTKAKPKTKTKSKSDDDDDDDDN